MFRLINCLSYPNICLQKTSLSEFRDKAKNNELFSAGSYSFSWHENESMFFVRDPLGINKLFLGKNRDGDIVVANRIKSLLDRGVHLNHAISCPAGHVVELTKDNQIKLSGVPVSDVQVDENFNLDHFKLNIKNKLENYFDHIAERWHDAIFVVCLSGGLDSSIIASIAKNKLKNVFAASFSFADDETILSSDIIKHSSEHPLSDDFYAASAIAETLDIPLIPVLRHKSNLSSAVSPAVHLGQDWRDFNVHCSVVNLFLAQDIRAHFPDSKVVVLTGDLMNEYVCDYHEEVINGTTYYPQPKIDLVKRRRFFMRGLDAGDREVGIFNAYGLTLAQAYSSVAEDYASVPKNLLEQPDAKMSLNGHLLPQNLLDKVGKAKVRAQVGGKDGGVLGAFHRLNLNESKLFSIWKAQFPQNMIADDPSDFIQFGRYRMAQRGES